MAREDLPGAETGAFTQHRVYVLDHSIKLAPALICVLSGFLLSLGHDRRLLIVDAIIDSDNRGGNKLCCLPCLLSGADVCVIS